ncbi:MAG: hypothetical protein ABI663_11530 [Chryseolinea sp.]
MKKIILIAFAALTTLSSCSFESYSSCPAYSSSHKITKHGAKAQTKYNKKTTQKNSWI